MESSEDEGELRETQSVNNYHFVDENEEPICFSILPFQWEEGQSMEICKKEIFLHGVGDDGLQIIYRQVIAWKLNLECFQAEISVLTKTMKWIMLRKPRTSFLDTIRKMMITIQSIHYLKRNHNSTEKSLWHHVRKFSSFEVRASPYDILDNASFVRRMMKRDDTLAKSELLDKLLTTTSKKANACSEGLMIKKTSDFINADDRNSMDDEAGDNGEDSDDLDCFDSVCAICDNGGELLCCEGKCLRSFHAFKEPGSNCKTLGYTRAEVKAIQNYKCWNCCSEKHQCFSCGKLGSSNLSNPEVFQCANATCGYFFHPKCVAKLLHCENKTEATDLEKNISFGQKFVCPFHKCLVCKGKEDKFVEDLQFAICRRCPTSYHRKCLPRTIAFEESEDGDIIQRAWDDLIPNRILIYCTKHAIDKKLGTPIRNHIILYEDLSKNKDTFLEPDKQKSWVKRKDDPLDIERYSIAAEKKKPKLEQSGFMVRKDKAALSQGKGKETKNKASSVNGNKLHVREKPKSLVKENREIPNSTRNHSSLPIGTIFPKMPSASDVNKNRISPSIVDSETQKRILALVRKSESRLPSFENYIKKLSTPTTHSYSARLVEFVDKSITLGKVEGAMEAVQTALQNINEDDVESIENAKDVCEPEFLYQIMKWKNKLSVYLSPFLHGKLYTSFGRHFTKKEKLMEIVDKLHCYVESGDMIVDFCCGANDFSILMKEKLEATGKKCNYRNYDVMPPKNNFKFTMKDWMEVQHSELYSGSQLIMGLNPPFGVRASLANKFIDKALSFRPKLLILIVPKETQRLDEKDKYDLIWVDDKKLSGKAFYLPGVVDEKNKPIDQWNLQAPPLYLWSRRDMTRKHMDIAKANGHASIISSHLEGGAEISNNHLEPKIANRAVNYSKGTVDVSISRKLYRQSTASKDNKKRPGDSDFGFRGSEKRKNPNKNRVLDKGKISVNNSEENLKQKKSEKDVDVRKSNQRYEVLPLPLVSDLLDGECSDMCISPSLEETHREDNVRLTSPTHGHANDSSYGIRTSNDQHHHETRNIQGRYIGDDRNSDRFYDLTKNNPLPIHGHNGNYGSTRYRSSDPYIVSLAPTMDRYTSSTMEKYHSSAIDKYAPRLDVLNPSLPAVEINGVNHGLPLMADNNYRIPSIREGGGVRLPSNYEIGYRPPSIIERYSMQVDEVNQYNPWLNNPNIQRPESDPSFLGGISHDSMTGFVSGPHISSNQGGWVDD